MPRFRRLRRSIRCHLKHGNRCPHIERHALHRPRRRRKKDADAAVPTMPAQLPVEPNDTHLVR
jgi:hypothetical protein